MTEITFKLESFEGPLDLLLHLISKHKLNINDIPITALVEQYISYINDMAENNMEIAGEFLEMAARLIYIKTVSLLPSNKEAEEMKKELQGKLIEYSLCKKAAELLKLKYQGNNIFVRNPLPVETDITYRLIHSTDELIQSYKNLNFRKSENKPVEVSAFSGIVSHKIVSVTSKIIFILRRLYTTGKVKTDSLYEKIHDRSERVATFLAVLELTKSGRIFLNDDNSEITFNRSRNKTLHSEG